MAFYVESKVQLPKDQGRKGLFASWHMDHSRSVDTTVQLFAQHKVANARPDYRLRAQYMPPVHTPRWSTLDHWGGGIINSMPNRRAVGTDDLLVELVELEIDGHCDNIDFFHAIVVDKWQGEGVPKEWTYATIAGLHKKDGTKCGNYRGILLMAHAGIVVLNIIADRPSIYCEGEYILPEEQCGFKPQRSTIDKTFVVRGLRQLAQKNTPFYLCFGDHARAYD